MLIVRLNPKEEKEKLLGFPWVFNNEVHDFIGPIENGCVCRIESFERAFVGYGFLNLDSKIMIRILTLKEEPIDDAFFKARMEYAIEHRKTLGMMGCCRVIFAEADGLPGLIVDQYGDYLSVSFLCLGMDLIKDRIVKLLIELLKPKGIYERSDAPVRLKEGLPLIKGFLYGEFNPRVEVVEDGIHFIVDIENGQKNRLFFRSKA